MDSKAHRSKPFLLAKGNKSMNAEIVARTLGGRRNGKGWMVRCPVHEDRTPSLSITDGEGGKLLVYCFAGCDARDVLASLQHLGLHHNTGVAVVPQIRRVAPREADVASAWAARADRIWRATVPIIGTPAETYLRHRGCFIPACSDLRFLPAEGA